MTQTGRLGLPYIVTAQAQKEVTHNEALNRLDVFVTPVVANIANAPPDSPNVGDLYIVGTSPTGDFADQANNLTQYLTGGWVFYTPFKWMDAVVESLDSRMTYDGSGWVPFGLIMRDSGEYLRVQSWQEDVDLSVGSSTNTNIPGRSCVIAVNTRVITAINRHRDHLWCGYIGQHLTLWQRYRQGSGFHQYRHDLSPGDLLQRHTTHAHSG